MGSMSLPVLGKNVSISSLSFTGELDPKYICTSCSQVLQPPVKQTSCGHRLCASCVDKLLNSSDTFKCPAGEEDCCTLISNDQIHPDRATSKELLRMPVHCINQKLGCDVTTVLANLTEHLSLCDYTLTSCPNLGCQTRVSRNLVQEHQKSCEFLPVLCEQCGEDIPQKDMTTKKHFQTCSPKPQRCAYYDLGCSFEGLPEVLRQHNDAARDKHNTLHAAKTAAILKERDGVRLEIDGLISQLSQLKNTLQEIPLTNSPLIQNLHKSIATTSENMRNFTSDLANKVDREELLSVTSTLIGLQDVSRMQESRIAQLEQQRAGNGGGGFTGDDAQKLQRMESQLGNADIRLAEYELRFRLLETASHNGKMTWKITNYERRKADAIAGRTVSLYSQPFYTSNYGYKMCARVYLNGDGMGKGSHLSIFFVVMRGEYDALLPWSFRQRVTLMLLDQSGAGRHITDTFRPDPTSTSFRRPQNEMNIASGSPLFAAHSVVESNKHLRDDTIFVRVHVDTTGLPDD